MSSIGLSTSAFLDLARRAAWNRIAWRQFSDILLRVSCSTASWEESTPSDNPDDPVNTAVVVFQAIGIIASTSFTSHAGLQVPSAAERAALILCIRPYLLTCTTHFINDIIIPGRDAEFEDNISEVLANLVSTLASARRLDATEDNELIAFRAPEELRSTGKTFFLTCVLTTLLFPTSSLPPTPCQEVLAQCFIAIGYVIGGPGANRDSLPPYARELYDALLGEPERFATLFLSCTVDAISRLKAERFTDKEPRAKGPAFLIGLSYRGIGMFLVDEGVAIHLLRHGFVRWTCEMMSTTSRPSFYRGMVKSTDLLDRTKRDLFIVGTDCVYIGYWQLSRLIQIYGAPIVQQTYDHGAVLSAARIQYLCFQYSAIAGRDTYMKSLATLGNFLARTTSYLVYYSVFKSAMRGRRQMRSLLTSEALGLPAFGIYATQLTNLAMLSDLFERNRPTICDSYQCPNLNARHGYPLRSCSGCRITFYCSQVCQKSDWQHRHREKCHIYHENLDTNTCEAISSRDVLFMNYVLHDIMYAHRLQDRNLVRHVNLTVCPPTIILRPLDSKEPVMAEVLARDSKFDGAERVPFMFQLPMGLRPILRVGAWDHAALKTGVEDMGQSAAMYEYDPQNSFV
ncbi:hypothetical protein BDZ89DRAFT_1166532 [Hymenopellis radicata]|nr:hypothetical protein BDZ89DRAFT_1166532 [Hymenopellis radicata]